jgi:hypothetical protein
MSKMDITGTLTGGEVEIDVDLDEVREHLEIMDRSDVEQMIDDHNNNEGVSDAVEALLDEFVGNNNPCSVGRSFQAAVEFANLTAAGDTPNPSAEPTQSIHPDEHRKSWIRLIVREELLNVMTKGLVTDE